MTIDSLASELMNSPFVDSPELESRWIIEKFGKDNQAKIYDAIERRSKGEPLAYVLGEKEFYGITFKVNKNVLIPRPETELLVETILNYSKTKNEKLKLLDLGCGSGCIGLSLLKMNSKFQLTLVDKSSGAIDVAQQNAKLLGLDGQTQFLNISAEEVEYKISGTFDIIAANPPYVDALTTEKDHKALSFEPAMALYAEDEGFRCIERWLEAIQKKLNEESVVMFEIGYDQGQKAKALFDESELFDHTSVLKDLSNHDRVIVGTRGTSWTL